jgi:hypothetical protein
MTHSRFRELVSGFLQQNSLVLAHEDPSEMLVSVGDIHVRLIASDGDDDGLLCIAEFLDEATRAELTSPSALDIAFKLNYEAHRAEDFHFAIDPQGQPVLLARFALSTLDPDALTAIVTHALDSVALHTLLTTTAHKRQGTSLDIPHYSLRA